MKEFTSELMRMNAELGELLDQDLDFDLGAIPFESLPKDLQIEYMVMECPVCQMMVTEYDDYTVDALGHATHNECVR